MILKVDDVSYMLGFADYDRQYHTNPVAGPMYSEPMELPIIDSAFAVLYSVSIYWLMWKRRSLEAAASAILLSAKTSFSRRIINPFPISS